MSRFLNTRNLRVKCANNGSARSIMTDGRRQAGRQAFVFRVIGSSTARIRERLADGDVIVVEVIGGPLLDRGFLGVVFISLRDVALVGLITCGRLVLGQGAQGPQRKCAGYLSTTSWKMKLTGRRKDRVIREKMARKEK